MSEIIDLKIQPFGAAQRRKVDEYVGLELAHCLANLFNEKQAITKIKAFPLPTELPYSELQIILSDLILHKRFCTVLRSFAPIDAGETKAELARLWQQETIEGVGKNEQLYFCAVLFSDYPRLLLFGNGYSDTHPNCILLDCEEARYLGLSSIDLVHQIMPQIGEIAVLYDVMRFAPQSFNTDQISHILTNPDEPRAASD